MTKPGQPSARSNPDASRDAVALDHDAMADTLRELLAPIAALAVARGLPYATVDELVRRAFVDAARRAQPGDAGERVVSRISAATGLNRREVTRLNAAAPARAAPRPSPATQVFTRWVADAAAHARRRTLPRQGPAPSFEALARSVTNDVHPRSLLDELCRLGLAREVDAQTVELTRSQFVPSEDRARMLAFLGSNGGDHLRAAVENVLAPTPVHLEQALFADELSSTAIEEIDRLVRTQWKALMAVLVPEINKLIERDRAEPTAATRRVRIGMYMYDAPPSVERAELPTPTPTPRKPSTRKTHR